MPRRTVLQREIARPRIEQLLIGVLCIAVATAVLALDSQILSGEARGAFVGHADRAHVATVAANVASGEGAVVNTEWLLVQEPSGEAVFPQRDPYWPTYPSRLISAPIRVLGQDYVHVAVLFTASLMKLLLIGAVFWSLRLSGVRTAVSAGASSLILAAPVVLEGVTGLTDMYFVSAFFGSAGLASTAAKQRLGRRAEFFTVVFLGIAAGFCALSRPPVGLVVLLILGALVTYGMYVGERRIAGRYLVSATIGVAVMVPWVWQNVAAFGTVIPPGYALVAEGARLRPTVGLPAAFFGVGAFSDAELPSRVDSIWRSFRTFIIVGLISGKAVPIWLSMGSVGITGAVLLRRSAHRLRNPGAELLSSFTRPELAPRTVFLAFVLTSFGVALALVPAVAFEPRYWMFLTPSLLSLSALTIDEAVDVMREHSFSVGVFLGAGLVSLFSTGLLAHSTFIVATLLIAALWLYTSESSQRLATAVATGALALVLVSWYVPSVSFGPSQSPLVAPPDSYARAVEVIGESATVLTSNPWQYSFHTGHVAIVVPHSEDAEVIREVARHFAAEYLVVSGNELRHPTLRAAHQDGTLGELFPTVYEDSGLFIGRVGRNGSLSSQQPVSLPER